jgi:sialate O-acetylesterase
MRGQTGIVDVWQDGGAPLARLRFCWGGSPGCNLSDGSGLPVGPFELALR